MILLFSFNNSHLSGSRGPDSLWWKGDFEEIYFGSKKYVEIHKCLENDTYSPKYWIFTSIGNIEFAHGPNKDKEWVKKTVYRDAAATVSKNSFLCICSI